MNRIYKKLCIPLIRVNSNVYAFFSGILMSLSTNVFTSLCFEPFNWFLQWHKYISTMFFIIASAICMIISVKVVNVQNYFVAKQINDNQVKREIIEDMTAASKNKWIRYFLFLIISFLAGVAMLGVNIFLQ